MRYFYSLLAIAALCLNLESCKKDKSISPDPEPTYVDFGFPEDEADFTIFQTNSYFQNMDTTLFKNTYYNSFEAKTPDSQCIGKLTINDTILTCNDTLYEYGLFGFGKPTWANQLLSIKLQGADFPSFDLEMLNPGITEMSFEGLDENKVDKEKGFRVNFLLQGASRNPNYVFSIYGGDGDDFRSFIKNFSTLPESFEVTPEILSRFQNADDLRIYINKGANTRHQVQGKTVDTRYQFNTLVFLDVK